MTGYKRVRDPGRQVAGITFEHIQVVERALGHRLPLGAVVHHVDEDKRNNHPSNLVACQGHSYHALLHARLRALRAVGDPGARKCSYCHQWITASEKADSAVVYVHHNGRRVQHRECIRAYQQKRRGGGKRRARLLAELRHIRRVCRLHLQQRAAT